MATTSDEQATSPALLTSEQLLTVPCHAQDQSPLFSTVPPEIRNEIFRLALAEYEDHTRPYRRDEIYYTPGYTCRRKVDIALLLTCRKIWIETRLVPLRNIECTVWTTIAYRRPPETRTCGRTLRQFSEHLTDENKRTIRNVRIFTRLHGTSDSGLEELFQIEPLLRPYRLTIAIRYADWRSWSSDGDLYIPPKFISRFKPVASINKLVFEFDVLEKKKPQLMELLRSDMVGWEFWREDGRKMVARPQSEHWSSWLGPTRILNGPGRHPIRYSHHPRGDNMLHWNLSMAWYPKQVC